jgi:hypothetical protein
MATTTHARPRLFYSSSQLVEDFPTGNCTRSLNFAGGDPYSFLSNHHLTSSQCHSHPRGDEAKVGLGTVVGLAVTNFLTFLTQICQRFAKDLSSIHRFIKSETLACDLTAAGLKGNGCVKKSRDAGQCRRRYLVNRRQYSGLLGGMLAGIITQRDGSRSGLIDDGVDP